MDDATASPTGADEPIALDVAMVLPGLARLTKRLPTLSGSLPLRAAQHCTPLTEGTAAGFYVDLDEPIFVRSTKSGLEIHVGGVGERFLRDAAAGSTREAIAALGFGTPPWMGHLLAQGGVAVVRDRLRLWTGYFLRPVPTVSLLVTRPFNRGAREDVVEHAIVASDRWTPLVVEIDASKIRRDGIWLQREIACVLPVRGARVALRSLAEHPQPLDAFVDFFDESYFAAKRSHPTGKYRRTFAKLDAEAASGDAVLTALAPRACRTGYVARILTPRGFVRDAARRIEYGVVRAVDGFAAHWDGHAVSRRRISRDARAPSLDALWEARFGPAHPSAKAMLGASFVSLASGEPYIIHQPAAFFVTPPGWSAVVDGYRVNEMDGMRGVIATDRFHALSNVWRLHALGRFAFPAGTPLLRILPMPRRLLRAGARVVPLDGR